MVSPLGFGQYVAPALPLDRETILQGPKQQRVLNFETQPTIPIVIKGDFYDLVYQPGPMSNRFVKANPGKLLGIA